MPLALGCSMISPQDVAFVQALQMLLKMWKMSKKNLALHLHPKHAFNFTPSIFTPSMPIFHSSIEKGILGFLK